MRGEAAVDESGTVQLTGALQALSLPAFVCDRGGDVKALTPAAEAMVANDGVLQLRMGRLHASNPLDTKALNDAIDAATTSVSLTVVMMNDGPYTSPLVFDVIGVRASPRVLVVARGGNAASERRARLLQTVYRLTSAEADIALQLSTGKTVDAIAASRGVAVGTVRVQIKAVLAKVGVSRQMELVARLSQL